MIGVRYSTNMKCKMCAAKHTTYLHIEHISSNVIQSCAQDPMHGYNVASTVKHVNCKNVNHGVNWELEKCVMCGESTHKLYSYSTFKRKSPEERLHFEHLHELCICGLSNDRGKI